MITRRSKLLALVAVIAAASGPARAAETSVAVAANFTEPAKEIAAAFSRTTGHTATLSFGSSGQFYAQIAHPASAPYGVAAIETLRKLGLYESLKPKIVQGNSIAQVYQFTATGAAELGFVALSQVIAETDGSRWIVPGKDHTPIDQQAVL